METEEIIKEFNLHKTLIEDFIRRWNDAASIDQLYSETLNFLNNCIKDKVAAQQVKDCVTEDASSVFGQSHPHSCHVTKNQRERICKLLQNKLESIAEQYVELRKVADRDNSPNYDSVR